MTWELDPAHTLIEFSAKHMMVSTVRGRFKLFSGRIDLDENDPSASVVDVTIDAASLDTGAAQRDAHLRSADFLDVEHFPTITFKSTRITLDGEDHARVRGDLTIRGVTHEVELDVTREGRARSMQGNRLDAYSITGAISRKQWGLEWNVALESGGWLVSDAVKIAIEAEVIEQVPSAAPSLAS
jgi:polyisoprenoid-binding protein YceI